MAEKKSTAKAAQPSEPKGPAPKGVQHHAWTTEAEYEKQIAMPVHLEGGVSSIAEASDGLMRYHTACGKTVGLELLRTTDDRKDVTCTKCKASRKKR